MMGEKIEALKRFINACNEILLAETNLAIVTKVNFTGVYMTCYDAREIAEAWLKKLED